MNERFKSIINSDKPVLVDFYAEWCEPCKQMSPILKSVRKELRSGVRVIKVNVDHHPVIVSQFGIDKLPTVMLFKSGQPHWTGVGVQSAHDIVREVSSVI
jgi:thioredoxin 1